MKRIIALLLAVHALSGSLLADCKVHKIKHVPYVITEPGKYILCNDVTYTGDISDGVGAAIKIESSDVKLCLFAHSITVTDPSAYGIWVNKGTAPEDRICEIDINNDAIKGFAARGIFIDNACKVHLDNMYTVGPSIGLFITNSSDILVENSEFSKGNSGGCFALGCQAITFRNTVWTENGVGLSLEKTLGGVGCSDTKIVSCSFLNSRLQHLSTVSNHGLLVKNSSFSRTEPSLSELVLIGLSAGGASSDDTCFEGCTFIDNASHANGITFSMGKGLIIDSCLFNISNKSLDFFPAALLLNTNSSNVLVTRSIFQGGGDVLERSAGISASGTNARIEECLFQGFNQGISLQGSGNTVRTSSMVANALDGIDISGSSNSVIDNTVASNPFDGVRLTQSSNVTVSGNTVVLNGQNGITCFTSTNSTSILGNDVLGNGGFGIFLGSQADGSVNNTVQHNRVHSQGDLGINNVDLTNNKFYFNTAFNNVGGNYNNVPTVVNPGDATQEGSNVEP